MNPSSLITDLKVPDYCDLSINKTSPLNKHVLAWVKHPGYATLYYSFDGGSLFQSISLASSLSTSASVVTGYIYDVAIQHTYNNYVVLVRGDDGLDKLFHINYGLGSVTAGYVFTSPMLINAGVKVCIDVFFSCSIHDSFFRIHRQKS